jgi:hypothetical protein
MSVESLRKQARILMWLVTVPFAAMVVLGLIVVGNVVLTAGRNASDVMLWYFPMFLYICAIWMIRQALNAITRGEMFDQVVPKLLFRVGLLLFAGALFNEIGRPVVTALLYGRVWMQTFDGSGVALGIVGATLALVAQLLRRAAAMRDELDGFF